jgi:hypothetical protein
VPVAWAPTNQADLFRRLMRYDPAAIVVEEVTDGLEELERLASRRLVVAGVRSCPDVPCLGKLEQRRIRKQCGSCSGKGCDRCRGVGFAGWSLEGTWQQRVALI